MMNKTRNNKLMYLASRALTEKDDMLKNDCEITDSYNGQVAALGVAIAMSGLLPALAIYYQDSTNTKVNKRVILDVIGRMIKYDGELAPELKAVIKDSRSLLQTAIKTKSDDSLFRELKREVEECSIALKQVIRTYKLVNDEKS